MQSVECGVQSVKCGEIMERCAMFKDHVVHGKTSGLVLGFPMFLRRILFPKKNEKT